MSKVFAPKDTIDVGSVRPWANRANVTAGVGAPATGPGAGSGGGLVAAAATPVDPAPTIKAAITIAVRVANARRDWRQPALRGVLPNSRLLISEL
jgi:hypothetical protein